MIHTIFDSDYWILNIRAISNKDKPHLKLNDECYLIPFKTRLNEANKMFFRNIANNCKFYLCKIDLVLNNVNKDAGEEDCIDNEISNNCSLNGECINKSSNFLLIHESEISIDNFNNVVYSLIKENYFEIYRCIIDMCSSLSDGNEIKDNNLIRIKTIENSLTLKERATNNETYQHIHEVIKGLLLIQHEISKRVVTHDQTKLKKGEVEIFAEYTPKLKQTEYGSDDYKFMLGEMQSALKHHYKHNRHHPEFFDSFPVSSSEPIILEELLNLTKKKKEQDKLSQSEVILNDYLIKLLEQRQKELASSINNMNLVDIIEMLIDWNAATKRHITGDIHKSIEINQSRFSINQQLINIFLNTIPLLRNNMFNLTD